MDDVSSEKVENLKSLNTMLLKETKDRRQQVETLVKAKAGLESELTKVGVEKKVLEAQMGEMREESYGLELEKSVLGVFVLARMGEMVEEKAEIERVKTKKRRKRRRRRRSDELTKTKTRKPLYSVGSVSAEPQVWQTEAEPNLDFRFGWADRTGSAASVSVCGGSARLVSGWFGPIGPFGQA